MKISRCSIHGIHETLGIDQDEICFYWILESDDEPSAQTAYQIVVREAGLGGTESNGLVLWDSGRCESSAQRDIVCKPKDGFRSTWAYSWQVSVWDHLHQVWHGPENEFFAAYPRSQLIPPLSMNQTYMPHTALTFRTWVENMQTNGRRGGSAMVATNHFTFADLSLWIKNPLEP